MATLIFKNHKLQGILKITEQATVFRATYGDAIEAYEKDTNKQYKDGVNIDKYYEHGTPTFFLVKDEGIYIMTAAKLDKIPDDYSHVCYAEGYEPDLPDYWEKCRTAVGGDDFGVSFRFTDDLKKGIRKGADIHIKVTTDHFLVHLVYPSKAI